MKNKEDLATNETTYDGDIYDQLQYLVEDYILLEVNKTF